MQNSIKMSGRKLTESGKAIILLHGRGATADDILQLKDVLNLRDFSILAPQAANYAWYPHSFLSPPAMNEPWLSSALNLLDDIVNDINEAGITSDKIFFAGFSQGACLTLEYIAVNARRWGGAAAFTGGLIGDKVYKEKYKGNFEGTPVFIGTSDPDPHIPVERVHESAEVLRSMNANVTIKIYPGMGHTINYDEIETVNEIVIGVR